MTATDPKPLARLVKVNPAHFVAELLVSDPSSEDSPAFGESPRVGAYVTVIGTQVTILCQITDVQADTNANGAQHTMGLLPLGDIADDGVFSRGLARYPALGSPVFSAGDDALRSMFALAHKGGLELGRLSEQPDLGIFADPNLLFSRHLAILGQSGTGKSWAVTSLIQRTIAAMPHAHIILLDLHGEYVWRGSDGQRQAAFPTDTLRHIDAKHLEVPYWLLTYREIVELLVDRNDPNASLHISFLREVLLKLRREANEGLGLDRLSVDSPVYFSLDALYERCKEANEQQFDFGRRNGPLFGVFNDFLLRFQSLYNDSRYDFLLRPQRCKSSADLETLLREFTGLGEPQRQITVIDLSALPSDVRPTVTSQIARLAFEFNYWNPNRRDFPLLLVCEEAHQYIPNRGSQRQQFGSSREMERIAKEGRKYGVGLCVVSQRPTELSETILSQCGTYICLRTTNPTDQEYIRRLMPQGEQGLADVLSTLRRGEALAVGDALTLPTRFRLYPPNPPPARSDMPIGAAWRNGSEDVDVGDIVRRWWNQKR